MKKILLILSLFILLPTYSEEVNNYKQLTLSNFTDDWFEPWEHKHYSGSKAPFVHLFHLEPAFLDRDLFLDYKINNSKDEKESEFEFELEWALTSRIGLVLEAPYRILEEKGEDGERGLGDIGFATRFLLFRDLSSILSLNIGMEVPTGKNNKGLSEDELVLNTSLSYWQGFGENFTWNVQLGMEQGLETEEKTFTYNTAFTYSLNNTPNNTHVDHAHDHGGVHFPKGMINFMLEFSGRNSWEGRDHSSELLFAYKFLGSKSRI